MFWAGLTQCSVMQKPPAVPMGGRMDILLQGSAQACYFHCRSLMLSPSPVPELCLAELAGQRSLEQSCCSRLANQAHLMPTSLLDRYECLLKSFKGHKINPQASLCLSTYLIYYSKDYTLCNQTLKHLILPPCFINNALPLFSVLSGDISKPICPHWLV